MKLKEILEKANYPCGTDRRNYLYKAVEDILNTGQVTVTLVENGFIKTTTSGGKWNIKISGFRCHTRFKLPKGGVNPYTILRCIGAFLADGLVRQAMQKDIVLFDDCAKCHGAGYIPGFAHIANGLCFDCFGLGKYSNRANINAMTKPPIKSA